MSGDPAVEVEHLVKRYARSASDAVADVSFSVRRGEVFGLLGPNGAGKTTTIGVLTTAVRPTAGRVRLMGIDPARDPVAARRRLAVVPQQANLDRSLRVREVLTYHAAYHGVPRALRASRAAALLASFGLADRGRDEVDRLSGGMAQRLLIARALMHDPKVLFLDEPTGRLDPQSRLFVWDRIAALRERGLAIVLTTHDMDEAERLCDRVAIMDHGRILVLDTARELKRLLPAQVGLDVRVRLPGGGFEERATCLRRLFLGLPGVVEVRVGPAAGEGVLACTISAVREDGLAAHVARAAAQAGGELRDLHATAPTLEDVFLQLTGRQLR